DYESDDELYEDEYDDIDTDLVGILRVKLDQVKGVLSSGRMDDFCVRIFKVNTGTAKKEAPVYTVNSVYGIHCVPVRSPKGQLLLEILDQNSTDLSIGCFSLPLNEMIARNPDRTYSKKNTHYEQINEIGLEAEFYSTRVESDRFHFSEDNIDINDLYRLIGLTFNASSADMSSSLACYFNFKSASDLFHAVAMRIMSDKQLMSVNSKPGFFLLNGKTASLFEFNNSEEFSADLKDYFSNGLPPPISPLVFPPVSPRVPPPISPPVSPKGRRVHEFEENGRNKVMLSTRSETRAVKQFVIEPWVTPQIKTAVILDDKIDRVLFIGKQTIQLWSNFTEKRTLQYIWCRPIIKKNREKNFIKEYCIKWAELTRRPDGEFIIAFEYEVDGISKSIETGFHLPRKDAPASFHTVRDASFALGFLNSFEQKSWPTERYRRYETLLDECQGIIRRALSSSDGDVFEHVEDFDSIESTDEPEHRPLIPLWLEVIGGTSNDDSKAIWSKGSILKVLMQFDCERANTLIEELLKKEKISLRFYDLEKHECPQSDLSYAISLGRTEIVRSLLRYYCNSAEKSENMANRNSKSKPHPENSLRLVVPAFSQLCSKHPDTALELVKDISYFKLNRPAVWSNKRENFAYSDREKSSDDVYKADADNDTVFKWSRFFSNEHRNESYRYLVCTVPLPNFTRYPEPPESRLGFLNVLKWRKYLSPFASAVLQGRYDMFGEPAMEAVINFSWRTFARMRYIFFIGVYFLYLASFMLAVTLDSERVQQGGRTEHLIRFFSSVVLLLGFIFIGLEVMQIIAYRSYYFTIYNLIDLASTLMPIIYAIGALSGSDTRRQYILRLRVFKDFGIPIFMIIEIFNRVRGIMFIIAIMVVAYTHIYWLLLSYTEVVDLVGNSTVTDQFATPQESLVSVFFFVTNNFGNISDAFGNPTIALLTIAFTFITAIVLLNILIALMSDVVGDAKTVGRHAWLKQKAELICELEMCTLTRKQRQRPDFFPYMIYYYAKSDSIKEYKKRLGKHRKKESRNFPKGSN
ncbi:5465_t:CDS:2, partial [Paraglomus occultum]